MARDYNGNNRQNENENYNDVTRVFAKIDF